MGRLLSVRHGQTDYNIQRRYTGQTEISLNQEGLQEAEALAEKLMEYPISMIYCSPMIRTRQTISPYLQKKDVKISYRDELKEINMGVYSGYTVDEVRVKYPEMFAAHRPEGAENREQVEGRLFPLIDEIIKKHRDDTILIVAHGYIQRCIFDYFMKPSDEEFLAFRTGNCVITEYEM